jgi:hypothetical protein
MKLREEKFWPELKRSYESNLAHYRKMLAYIEAGGRIVDPHGDDLTDTELQKARYYEQHYRQKLLEAERDAANDNDIPIDAELADLITGDW